MNDTRTIVDVKGGTQSKSAFWDQAVYDQEMVNVFQRAWLFLTHESQLPEPGDFFSTYMGEDPVIVARQSDRSIKAFVNACTHRGNQICQAESGNTKTFTCNYHGWSYGLDGELVNVPMEKTLYFNEIDKASLGAKAVPKVESYKGFVFGCFDPAAPSLQEYLGDMAWYIDTFADVCGGIEFVGHPMKSVMHTNWKVPAEGFNGDSYHIGWTHAAALNVFGGPIAGLSGNPDVPLDGMGTQIMTRHGHGFGAIWNSLHALSSKPEQLLAHIQQQLPAVREKLGKWRSRLYGSVWNAGIFPNCSFLHGVNVWKVWQPRGPREIEVWTWVMVHKEMPDELKQQIVKDAVMSFGTAGTFEADDGENMEACTWSSRGYVAREGRVNIGMGKGHDGRHPELPGIIGEGPIGETGYRNFHGFWQEMMNANSWAEIHANDANWGADWANQPVVEVPYPAEDTE